jgi:hypothetical protein
MRKSAGQKNPSEWFKRSDCWKDIQNQLPELTDPLPPEFSYSIVDGHSDSPVRMVSEGTLSVADYDRIARCMRVPAAIWLEVAERGQQTATIHWKVANICRTVASYAAGGWQRKPSAKQAKPALDALRAVERAGLVKSGVFDQTTEADNV